MKKLIMTREEYITACEEWNSKQHYQDKLYDIDEVICTAEETVIIDETMIGETDQGFVMFEEHFYQLTKKRPFDWLFTLLGIKNKSTDKAVDDNICDFSGQGRDKYGR